MMPLYQVICVFWICNHWVNEIDFCRPVTESSQVTTKSQNFEKSDTNILGIEAL